MTGDRLWTLGGESAEELAPATRALAELYLRKADGDPLLALVCACESVGAMSEAVSAGMARGRAGGLISEALGIVHSSVTGRASLRAGR